MSQTSRLRRVAFPLQFLRPELLGYASIEVIPATPAIVCAYCPTFDPTVAPAPGTSHGICPACIAKFEAGVR